MIMDDDINKYIPSVLNPRGLRKNGLSLTQNSLMSRSSLSLKRNNGLSLRPKPACISQDKENSPNIFNITPRKSKVKRVTKDSSTVCVDSVGFSAIEDLATVTNNLEFSPSIVGYIEPVNTEVPQVHTPLISFPSKVDVDLVKTKQTVPRTPLISLSSATELDQIDSKSDTTVYYDVTNKPTISVSFGVNFCNTLDVSSKNSAIKRIVVSHNDINTTVDCEIVEGSRIGTESEPDMEEVATVSPQKRSAVAVNFEIKKKKLSEETAEDSKILILNTSAIEKISHVIVQPPNYKIVKGKISDIKNTFKNRRNSVSAANDGIARVKLKQKSIDSFFAKCSSVFNSIKVSNGRSVVDNGFGDVIRDEEMSKNSGVADAIRSERVRKSPVKGNHNETAILSGKSRKDSASSRQEIKTTCSSPRGRHDSTSSQSPRKNVDSIHFSLPPKSVSNKRTSSTRTIPNHKIVAGTHFAVDAFSYGEIPNVKHYFLTHFHSDHYSGLKKGFNKLLFCSKITADLCISRLGVSPKCIHVVNVDETIKVEGVEVTALEANHCPGALMLVFTLPNGKTLLHTGDFRASPIMESYPVFWNKDIHTIYLDTTYCNPRYDFPTQEQSLEMALYILRQKKLALEKIGKKFSSVLIVCGTYTIGKEKFFLGMSRRVGCSVWACPEKERVLQALAARPPGAGAGGAGAGAGAGGAGAGAGAAPPNACQLHVVPMRDLTHEKLRSYLESLKGAFAEVVAFKPSGWENGKSASVEKDLVTIHGIPYSEHSSFSELIRFVKFLKPKQVVPTVDISGGVRAVQKYFPCPLVYKDDLQCQSKVTDFFSIQNQQQVPAVT